MLPKTKKKCGGGEREVTVEREWRNAGNCWSRAMRTQGFYWTILFTFYIFKEFKN